MKIVFAIIFTCLSALSLHAQNKIRAIVQGMQVIENKIVVYYDIEGVQGEYYNAQINFLTSDFKYVFPVSISGDTGIVQSGRGKRIEWDILSDMGSLSDPIRPNVVLNGIPSVDISGGGPANAFLSCLVPGLGDYFVADTKQMSFKPWFRTASSLGLISLGVVALGNRVTTNVYSTTLRGEKLTEVNTSYWLFNNDAELFLFSGSAIWIGDILWVASKGKLNQKLGNVHTDAGLSYIPGGMGVSFSFIF